MKKIRVLLNKSIFLIAFVIISLVCMSPFIIRATLFNMPEYSDTFDCDDASLFMLERLEHLGINATPIIGNLRKTGERYRESDHVWLLVEIAGQQMALDQGFYCYDRQHYEGFLISKQRLLKFVAQDLQETDEAIINPSNP